MRVGPRTGLGRRRRAGLRHPLRCRLAHTLRSILRCCVSGHRLPFVVPASGGPATRGIGVILAIACDAQMSGGHARTPAARPPRPAPARAYHRRVPDPRPDDVTPSAAATTVPDLAGPLLPWYLAARRDLPWRAPDATPWGVLVSEFMLQQTQVDRVLPRWHAWLDAWPTPADLAAALAGDAIRAWGRLGYPRRAVWLHAAALQIVERHGGRVPDDLDALLALRGVGNYTARAVLVFAFGQRHPVVDTNIRRVLARAVDGVAAPGPPNARRDLAAMAGCCPATPGGPASSPGRSWSSGRSCARRARPPATAARSPIGAGGCCSAGQRRHPAPPAGRRAMRAATGRPGDASWPDCARRRRR